MKDAKIEARRHDDSEEEHFSADGSRVFFLKVRGVPVAMAKINDVNGVPELHDIETREGYRHQGYAKELLRQVAEAYGQEKVVHDGGYTPDGFNYIHALTAHASSSSSPQEVKGPQFSPMTFMEDWDCEKTKFA